MRQTDYMYKLVSYMAGLKDKTYTITQILRFYSNTGSSGNIMTGAGGGGSNMKAAYANAFGGSYKIPAAFGFEGASPAPGLTASGGERVTVTPEGQDQEVVFADKSLRRLALMIRDITLTRV